METQKFRVFNRSRERFLSLEVSVVDTTSEPFKMLIEELAVHADIGLWLKPYRGIPAAPGLPPFYLVYLDKDYRVVQEVESYPSPEVKPLNPRTASALVLPARTIFASQTLPGDQLEFSVADDAEEMERRRQVLSSRSGPGSVAQRKESAAEEPLPKTVPLRPCQTVAPGACNAQFRRWLRRRLNFTPDKKVR
jgi:hypothetical protein